jgi:hypothetical protein
MKVEVIQELFRKTQIVEDVIWQKDVGKVRVATNVAMHASNFDKVGPVRDQ